MMLRFYLLLQQDHKKERERQRQLLRQEYRERFGCEVSK